MRPIIITATIVALLGGVLAADDAKGPPATESREKGQIRVQVTGEVYRAGTHYLTTPSLRRFIAEDKPGVGRTAGERVMITRKQDGEFITFRINFRDLTPEKDFVLQEDDVLFFPHGFP